MRGILHTLCLAWYNPRTGEYQEALSLITQPDGSLSLPEKPDLQDWVLMIEPRG